MHVLVVEPFDGGSHKNFLDGWAAHSRHRVTRLSLPGKFWKWRMRHGPATLAAEANALFAQSEPPAVVVGSSMLNLAEFRGLIDQRLARVPMAIYFHENQFAYPDRRGHDRDRHFALSNLTSALAADAVWFNSAYNRDSFIEGTQAFLKQMPTRHLRDAPDQIAPKSEVLPPGIAPIEPKHAAHDGPLHIAWVARWEHDKNPDDFFAALEALHHRGVDFRLSVLGERFRSYPAVFDRAQQQFADRLEHFGFQATRDDYLAALRAADVVVSTAHHEFFGLAVMEGASAGCVPVLPRRLVYPELFDADAFFYDGTVQGLTARLAWWAQQKQAAEGLAHAAQQAHQIAQRHHWPQAAARLDEAVARLDASAF
jgi:glycosyltransferase involved in cell wall biosynthesis